MNKPFSLYGCIDNIENRMPNNNISINQLINHYNAKKFQQLVEDGQKFVNQNSNSAMAWNLLALGHRYNGNMLKLHLKFTKIYFS